MRFHLRSGLSLRYVTRGRGRTIALLHPVGLRAEFWDPTIDALEDEFRLIAIDTRGHGESDAPSGPFSLDDCADDVSELLRAIGQPPAIVAGCSMGGMIAQGVAVRAPDVVAGIVVANTGHLRNAQGRATMDDRARRALAGMPAVLETTLSRWFDERSQRADPSLAPRCAQWLLAADPVVHSWSWQAIRDLDYAQALSKATPPLLAIAGTRDQATPVSALEALAAAVPRGSFRAIDAGHLGPIENPALFAAALREFATNVFKD